MQNYHQGEVKGNIAFDSKLEDVPGGITVAINDLTQGVVKEGTPVGFDVNGLYHVVKTTRLKMDVGSTDNVYAVEKGHNLKVGDVITNKLGAKAYTISAVDTKSSDKDVVTLTSSLGVALKSGDVLFEAKSESASNTSTFKYDPFCLTGTSFDVVKGDNHLTDGIVRGSVREANIGPIHADIKAKLPLIRFV